MVCPAMSAMSVLLTGGPGGGKTSTLATLRDHLTKGGFQVLIVPEASSMVFSNTGGYDPAWQGTPAHVDLQEILMKYQIMQEDTFKKISSLRPWKPHVILFDRGLLEGKLFCSDAEWAESLKRLSMTEQELLNRYDMVIHMTTVAAGMPHLYDYGPGSSNPSRYHTADQAKESDERSRELYQIHPQFRVVQNFPDFAQKIEATSKLVFEALHVDGLAGPRERILVPAETEGARVWPVKRDVYNVYVNFLDADFTESVRRREAVSSAEATQALVDLPADRRTVLYEKRKETHQGERTIHTRQVLTEAAYHLLSERKGSSTVRKRSVCFMWDGNHYELCSYFSASGDSLVDFGVSSSEVLDMRSGATVPPWLKIESKLAPPAEKEKRTPRKLMRCTTADAAYSAEERLMAKRLRVQSPPRSPARQGVAPKTDILSSPSLSKVAARAAQSPLRPDLAVSGAMMPPAECAKPVATEHVNSTAE
eukprot:TRINITY_DN76849_c0_g1_i1.p1 TRINITY_DN76849_c0_g1~~TRINITY_DN76849_c0_g1_i1.p1  ORF type:complete len:479 (-),score=93.80 TRINITY_DN76849_c0_g1_i1:84-1520(-)